jgi:hypothetical protein
LRPREEEEQDDEPTEEPTRQVEMMAGHLFISAEGETTEEAAEGAKDLWDKAIEDISEMPDDERNRIGLQ